MNNIDLNKLRNLIGKKVDHHGVTCEIIEILEDGPMLILRDCELHPIIQADQHGEAHRRVPTTRTIPIYCHDKQDFTHHFLELGLDKHI